MSALDSQMYAFAGLVAAVFVVFRLIAWKFASARADADGEEGEEEEEEDGWDRGGGRKPAKALVQDAIVVFMSVLSAQFIATQFHHPSPELDPRRVPVLTQEPNF